MTMVNASNLGFGGSGIPDTLPQAIAELQGQKFTFVTGAAAGTRMEVEGMDSEDHIGAILNMTDSANVDVANATVVSRSAEATIECLTTAVEDDTVVVNGKTYTVKDVVVNPSYNTPPGVVPIDCDPSGNDSELLAERLAVAIMSGDSSLTAVVEGDGGSPELQSVVRVTVREPGTDGNAYTLTETGTSFTVSGPLFTGGLAEEDAGFISTDTLTGKTLLVIWYDRNP